MSRCQHNEKIVKFCITPNCNHPISGGCQYCFKRYHCHISQAKALKETQVMQILKQLTSFEDKKTKIRPLKQAIYNYFNIIKGQLSTYIDSISSDLLNRVTFPYIKKQGNLSIVKKLKHKQYNKLTTEQMIRLNEFKNSNPHEKLQSQEIFCYFQQTNEVNKKVLAINNLYKQFEKEAQQSYMGQPIMSVSIYYKKIMEIFQHIETEKNIFNKKFQQKLQNIEPLKLNEKIKYLDKKQQLPAIQETNKQRVQFTQDSIKKNKQDTNQKRPSIQTEQVPEKIQKQIYWSQKKQNRSRKVSIDTRCNDLLGRSRLKTYEEKQKQILQRKQKLQELMNKTDKKERISGSSQNSNQNDKMNEIQTSDKFTNKSLAQSQVSSIKNNNGQQEMYAYTLLPECKQDKKLYQQFQTIEKKTMKIPVNVIQENAEGQQCQSPILKLKKSEKHKPAQGLKLDLFKVQQTQHNTPSQNEETNYGTHSQPIDKPIEVSSQSGSETSDKQNVKPQFTDKKQMNFTQRQTNSIFLLAESLKLSAKKAIPLLQAALKYAPNNFSAAEYLSFLYLEQNKPKQSLKVCNEALKQISGEPNCIQISFHLFNNKAAALNALGRFSESIPILQKCIEVKKKDILFKNLGDAYFNLGIIEKAMRNYENALVMNDDNHQALYNLGACLYLQKNYDSSKLKVQKALMLDSQNHDYLQLYKQIGTAIQQQKVK